MPRGRLIAVLLMAVVVGVVSGILISRGEDDEGSGPPPTATAQASAQAIETTVRKYVEAASTGNAGVVCGLEAQGGTVTVTGQEALAACAKAAGVKLEDLPPIENLSVSNVKVTGHTATAEITGGATLELERVGGTWKISGFEAGECCLPGAEP